MAFSARFHDWSSAVAPQYLIFEVATGPMAGDTGDLSELQPGYRTGFGTIDSSSLEVAEDGTFDTVAAGYIQTCAIATDRTISCWGALPDDQAAPSSGEYNQLSCGPTHCCAIDTDGGVTCWGSDTYGQTRVPSGEYSRVSVSWGYSCAVDTDGWVRCWGMHYR